jgi:glycosyltransferase involved in cell wall biosynthesis
MLNNKKIIVILPAYNAEKTLKRTYDEIPFDIVDEVILTDDYSSDKTISIAKELGINHIIEHKTNKGYGANQKSCYNKAIELKADVILMLHPDYQYTPKLIPEMCEYIISNSFDIVLGSRILNNGALNGGMPLYKYISNRFLTLFQNIMMRQKLSEYHTGYRCFNSKILLEIPFQNNSNDFIFDNEILAQCLNKNARIKEIYCPTKYDEDSSSINFSRSLRYGFGVMGVSIKYFLNKQGIYKFKLFI